MQLRYAYLLLVVPLIGSICPRGSSVVNDVSPVLSSARLYYDDGPAYQDSVRMIVRDRSTWQDIWSRATSTQASPPPRPTVDFDRDMVIVVGAGRMNAGDVIRVDSAGVRRDNFVVVVRTILECQRLPAEAYPVEIVRVERQDRPVEWIERRERAAHCMDSR